MDPLTQGLLGGVAAQAVLRKRVTPAVTVAGILGGMAPDLDVFIRSQANPLLMYEYHRHFTHSLAFIPVGGALVGFLLWLLLRRKPPLATMLIAAIAGFATHGLLDACTSYGTMLYWPFSRERVAWDNIFIIDPFYT
ncbi:metal-dependent hydrolase, partial [bacterium]